MDSEYLTHLENQLRAEALNIRKAALDELALVPADEAVPILQRLLDTPDFGLHRATEIPKLSRLSLPFSGMNISGSQQRR